MTVHNVYMCMYMFLVYLLYLFFGLLCLDHIQVKSMVQVYRKIMKLNLIFDLLDFELCLIRLEVVLLCHTFTDLVKLYV